MAACGQCGRENVEAALFCSWCGGPLAAPRPERRKLATLLFCDVSGSTALGERADAETVRDIMGRYVRDTVEAEVVEPVAAKGKSEPVPAYRVVSVLAGADALARRLDVAMVGRDAELALLRLAFDEAVSSRSCRLLSVVGQPGVGKSR